MMKTLTPITALILLLAPIAIAAVPLPEHPRPDFERPAWVNLNGPWQFDFDPNDEGERKQWFKPGSHKFGRQIVVPYPWESRLSGIADTEYKGVAWYSREVTLPKGGSWDARDAWLIVGACDWEAKVWIDGRLAGQHVGGYVPFEMNLGKFARPGQTVTIVIRAMDKTDPQQPSGKQINWYTRNSGIWQTVYLEQRAKSYIQSIRGTPNIITGTIKYDVAINRAAEVSSLQVSSPADEFKSVTVRPPAATSVAASSALALVTVDKPELWSPDSPKLYPVRFELLDANGKVLDTVHSYFGLREISVAPASGRDYQYIYLNGKPVYLRGLLHQSFHPEGIYQYPDDATVRGDYELCKQTGINFVRIHIKVPLPRELYWADKLGVLIMEDIPCYWEHTPIAQQWWQQTMEATLARDFNHPSIFAWVDFNETWGLNSGDGYNADRQEWVERMYRLTKKLDPTRLVEDNSPCNYDHVATDINSWHFYINDYEKARQRIHEVVKKTYPGSTFNYIGGRKQGNEPLINSEYGGIGADQGDQDVSWCFKFLTNELRLQDKICGYIYTELSDIEWEHNGFVNYDRTPKEFGYDFWHPGMTLADLNGADFVGIDGPPMIELKPCEHREIPLKISHWSDRKGQQLTLRYRTDWMDGFGRRTDGQWQTKPAKWEPFTVVDQSPVIVTASKSGPEILGALLVEVLDGDTVVARNYVNLQIDRGPQPRVQAITDNQLALRFTPIDFADYTFDRKLATRQEFSANKVAGQGAGKLEYRLKLPEGIALERLKQITLHAELASRSGDHKLAWPARKKAVAYPQTDANKWPSDVTIYINDQKAGMIQLADDPADSHGALSHARGYQGSHGYLIQCGTGFQPVNQTGKMPTSHTLRNSNKTIEEPRASARAENKERKNTPVLLDTISIRLEVPADAKHVGGLAIYGQNAGCYPVDPTVVLQFDGPHGLATDYRSDQLLATDLAMQMLLPTAESPAAPKWQFTTDKPGDQWTSPTFDDSKWRSGKGGFGVRKTEMAIVTTQWDTPDIWLRNTITIDDITVLADAQWRIYHDDDIEIIVNGTKVLELKGFEARYIDIPLDAIALRAFKNGQNTIAVHCRQIKGKQNVDVGLIAIKHRQTVKPIK